jgi:hypothetical protein
MKPKPMASTWEHVHVSRHVSTTYVLLAGGCVLDVQSIFLHFWLVGVVVVV